MKNNLRITFIVALSVFICGGIITLAENGKSLYNNRNRRDPFIPLIDETGNLRKSFEKSVTEETELPQVSLMGISKVGNTLYVLIDGELLKEGETFKNFYVEKIELDKVTLRYGEKTLQMKWKTDEK